MNEAPAPTPAPIHDIVDPIPFLPFPIWMAVVAGILVLVLVAGIVWWILSRKKPKRELTPLERALAGLGGLAANVDSMDAYPFSIEVSDVLREYLRDERGLRATTQTSREFLESVRQRNTFSADEQADLERFLEKADLIKFARIDASGEECRELLAAAESLVRRGEAGPVIAAGQEGKP